MKWSVSLLGLLLGGCVSILGRGEEPMPAPVPAPAVTATAAQQSAVAESQEIFTKVYLPQPELRAEQFLPVVTLFGEESVDPVTVADNLLLSSAGQSPPENEGETVVPEEVVEEVVFDFPVVENDKVRYFIDYYSGPGRRTFARWLERSGAYIPMMRQVFKEAGLPQDLAYLSLIESGLNPRAYSWAHAAGPWQFIESTGRIFGLDNTWWYDERRDFEKSTRAATRFLGDLHRRFDGNWYLAVAGYNAGGGKISRAIRKYGSRDFWEISRGKYLQAETRNYVPKLLAALLIAKEPEKYGFTDLDYHPPLAYDTVTVPTATDLEVIARCAGSSYEEIKALNPELKRWCTPPGVEDYRVRVPKGSAERFAASYAEIPERDRANYKRHRIAQGDTLLALAQRYSIRVDDIIALNDIRNPRALRIGTDLILPMKKGFTRLPVSELEDDYIRTRRQVYTVRKGDSLWSIARRFSVSEKQLRVWNRLGWSNVIRPGQRLIVSAKASRKVAAGSTKGPVKEVIYRVRPGDTLWEIGRRYDVATRQIMSWNRLDEGHVLQPGDKLTLLVPDRKRG